MLTCYEALGLTPSASPADITRAYIGIAQQNAPDHTEQYGLDERYERVAYFMMASDAYMVLSDWQEKAKYDAWLFELWYQDQQLAVEERGEGGYVDPSTYPYPPYTPPPPPPPMASTSPPPPPPPSSEPPTDQFGTDQTSLEDSDDESLVLDSKTDVKIVRERK
jgi:hypothetical protein